MSQIAKSSNKAPRNVLQRKSSMTLKNGSLGPILEKKKYFAIGEVSKLFDIKTHVLRYWEKEFDQLKPSKRRGRRYYQQKDLGIIGEISRLLYEDGFTVEGARQQLANGHQSDSSQAKLSGNDQYKELIKDMIAELKSILNILSS